MINWQKHPKCLFVLLRFYIFVLADGLVARAVIFALAGHNTICGSFLNIFYAYVHVSNMLYYYMLYIM